MTGLLAVAAGALLALQSAAHPELRLVDFIEFAGRARGLAQGGEAAQWLSARYPVGYPLLLVVGHALLGTVWLAGRTLAWLAGVGAVVAVARWLGPATGAWLLAQAALLECGATAGTDLPAFALGVGALALAAPAGPGRVRGGQALAVGLLAGGAVMMRYPAVVFVPVALLGLALGGPGRSRRLGAGLAGVALATAPHWGAALAGLGPLLPDPSENAAIGGGPQTTWWPSTLRAGQLALQAWPAWLGTAGLAVGLWRRDRRALLLLVLVALHLSLLGFFFSNERLVLPATLGLALGAGFLVPGRAAALLLAPAALSLWTAWPRALEPAPGALAREEIVAAASTLQGPFAATSPWFHVRQPDGWIQSPVLVKQAAPPGASPAGMPPEALLGWARAQGIRYLVLDVGRVHQTYPALKPLLSRPPAELTVVARAEGWRVYALPTEP